MPKTNLAQSRAVTALPVGLTGAAAFDAAANTAITAVAVAWLPLLRCDCRGGGGGSSAPCGRRRRGGGQHPRWTPPTSNACRRPPRRTWRQLGGWRRASPRRPSSGVAQRRPASQLASPLLVGRPPASRQLHLCGRRSWPLSPNSRSGNWRAAHSGLPNSVARCQATVARGATTRWHHRLIPRAAALPRRNCTAA